MLHFEFDFEMKQGMLWEISSWVLRSYWLITYMRFMLNCHIIENWERERNRKKKGGDRKAY